MSDLATIEKEVLNQRKIQAVESLKDIASLECWNDYLNQLIIGYLSSKSIQEDGDTPDADLIFRVHEPQKIIKTLVE